MGNRLTVSKIRSVPEGSATEVTTDRASSDSEAGSCSDSVLPPTTPSNRGRRTKLTGLNDIGLGNSSDHDYSHRVNFGSFYLRMGAVGRFTVNE